MAKTQVPQQKTFSFAASVLDETRDEIINDWRKEMIEKGNFPSPNAPVYFENIDGNSTFILMYAETIDVKN
jgi:hypothetical protein